MSTALDKLVKQLRDHKILVRKLQQELVTSNPASTEAWNKLLQLLDTELPAWRESNACEQQAALLSIQASLCSTPTLAAYLCVRGADTLTVLTWSGAQAYNKVGYQIYPLYLR